MGKFALGAIFSLLCVALPATEALAADGARKHVVKKKARQTMVLAAPSAVPRERTVRRVMTVNGKRKVVYQRVTNVGNGFVASRTMGDLAGLNMTRDPLDLKSNVAFVLDQANSEILFEKNAGVALPIASITKMMTGLVVVEANQDMDEILTVTEDDVDHAKFSSSRLRVGAQLTRANMLHIALMSSENRAASALGRHYPGGMPAFVDAMNAKAQSLGMTDTHYVDSSGLSKMNVASARDLAKLAMAAYQHPVLREYSTDTKAVVEANGRPMHFGTTNRLISAPGWEIGLQKTGFINEAGRCMMIQAVVAGRAVIMVLLDAKGSAARAADAGRMRKWLEALKPVGLPTGLPTSTLTTGAVGGGTGQAYSTGM
jgi:D-alanyl-D-alanine endopeptidase (penicillin-binding protein 7)